MKPGKNFVTIFTEARNFHLVKDVGQVPYHMHKQGGYNSTLVCYKNDPSYPFLETEVKGLNVEFIPDKGRIGKIEIGILQYLKKNAKRIDILHLFHFRRVHYAYIRLYKLLNPGGRVYIKLDLDIAFFKQYDSFFYSRFVPHNRFLKYLQRTIIQNTDVFSAETKEAFEHIGKVIPAITDKLIHLPNGIDGERTEQMIGNPNHPAEKENLIISVSRLGTEQKNTELLMESLLQVKLGDWQVYLIGSETAEFSEYKKAWFARHPHMKEKVLFTGNIEDRKELFSWYKRAKVFALSSRFEGFPLCLPEAQYFGCYILSTPLAASQDMIPDNRFGAIAKPDPNSFGQEITRSLNPELHPVSLIGERASYAKENFSWEVLIHRLIQALN